MTPNDVKIVADNIDDFIEVADGTTQLRKALLALAVSGYLVPQAKPDEVVLRQNISGNEEPFPLPKNWAWRQLEDICNIDYGTRIVKGRNTTGDYDVYGGGGKTFTTNSYNRSDTVIISRFGMSANCVRKIQGRFFLNDSGLSVSIKDQDTLLQEYLDEVMFAFEQKIYSLARGVAQKNLYVDDFRKMLIPLPPLSEQKKIVEKLVRILPKIPELEIKKRERDEVRTRLARSAMYSLGRGESKIAFEHLAELIKNSADLKELEGALLTLAVSGKLLSQDKKEGTAGELYAKIQSVIESGVKGRKKKTKESTPISPEELPFDIPKSWKWVRLMEIGKLDTGKTPRTGVTGNYAGDIPFVGPGDVQQGKINSYSKLITKQGASESKYLYPGDVLMVCIGGTIGKTALVSGTHAFNQQINKITPCLVDSTFLFCVFQSGYFQRLVWSKASGGATPLVNLTRWSSCVVPLPPLAEQKRIVKKVEEVVSLVSKLKPLFTAEK